MVLLLVVSLAGCGGNKQTDQGSVSQPAEKEVKVITIKYGHNYPTDSPAHKAAEAFKKEIETKTEGSIKVDIFPAMQLGSNREQLEALQQGSIQVDLQPVAIIGNFAPELQMLDLPYLFPNADVMWEVLDGECGERLLSGLEEKGIYGLGFTWTGFKHITANKPIEKLEDLKGLKVRVMNSPLLMEQYRGWGANPIPIDFGELYNALQQKVVDGQENGYFAVHIQKYYEVQSHLAETDHAPLLAILMANKAWYDGLSAEHQKIVDEAGRLAVITDRKEFAAVEQQAKAKVIEQDMRIFVMPQSERERLKKAAEPAYQYVRDNIGTKVLEEVQAAVKQIGE